MADLKTKLTLDGSDFTRGMNDASKSVEDFTDASKMSASELLNQMKSMDKLGRSTGNYRSQLGQISRQIQDLTVNYRAMSDEMKNSDFGQAVAAKIQELTQKAGEYKDAILDAQMSVKALASDTAGWDAMKQGIDTVSAGLQIFVATGVLGKKSTEQLVAVLAKLKAMEAATNAVIKIGNALQKQSALMMGVAKVQAAALARAKDLETAATGKATIAQRLFNAVAKANPYVLLATALIAVGTALVAFAKKSDEAKKKEEELQHQTERTQKKMEDFRDTVGGAVGKVVAQFKSLQTQWSVLKTEAEKKKFIDDNATAFENLGLKINDVTDAQKVLVDQAPQVIAALEAQARAAGVMDLYTQSIQDLEKAQYAANKVIENAKQKYQAGVTVSGNNMPSEWKDAGLVGSTLLNPNQDYDVVLGTSDDGWMTWIEGYRLTEQGAQKYYDYVSQQQQQLVNEATQDSEYYKNVWVKAQEDAIAAVNAARDLVNPMGGGNGNGSGSNGGTITQEVEVHYTEGSYAEAQAMVNQLQTDLNNMSFDDPAFGLVVAELDQWKQRAADIKDAMSLVNAEVKHTPGSYAEAAAMVSMLSKELQELDPNTEEFRNVKFELESWTETLDEIKAQMQIVKETAEEIEQIDPFEAWKSGLSAVDAIYGATNRLYKTLKDLPDAIEECENGFEAMFVVIDAILETLSTITTIMDAINALKEISAALDATDLATQEAKAATSATEAATEAGMTATKATNATIDTVAAAAAAGKSASAIPVVGWAIAIGAIAAIVAAIVAAGSSLKFAGGGIVPGSSFAGDHIHAQLNSGEMVLNQQQQSRLFNMLDSDQNGMNGKVEFVIKGQELKGVLNNYDKKMSRV